MIGAWGKQQRGGKRMLICVCLKQFPLLFSCSVVSDPLWPRTAAHHTSLPFTNFQEFAQTHVHWVDDSIQPSHPLSSPLPMSSVFPGIRVFFNESGLLQWVGSSPVSWVFYNESGLLKWVGSSPMSRVFSNELGLHIRGPKYWSFSFSISSYNEYSGLISFRTDWFDLRAVQETLRVFSSTTVWKHQFFHAQPPLWSISHIHTWLLEKP